MFTKFYFKKWNSFICDILKLYLHPGPVLLVPINFLIITDCFSKIIAIKTSLSLSHFDYIFDNNAKTMHSDSSIANILYTKW